MKNYLLIIIAAAAMLVSSCGSSQALQGDVQAVSAKLDGKVKAFRLQEDFNGTIKMRRDAGILISLSKYGIEGVRITCTPDSVLIVNRLTKTYARASFREVDALFGGDGTITFKRVQAYLWNDKKRSTDLATNSVGGFIPVDTKTSYGRSIKAGDHHIPKSITVDISGGDGAIEAGRASVKFNNIKTANDWYPSTDVSSKYTCINLSTLARVLFKK